MTSFNEMFPLARMFPLAVMHSISSMIIWNIVNQLSKYDFIVDRY